METIYKILEFNPVLTLCIGAVLAVIAMFLFKNEIKAYLKKKFDLYEEREVISFIIEAVKESKKDTDFDIKNIIKK